MVILGVSVKIGLGTRGAWKQPKSNEQWRVNRMSEARRNHRTSEENLKGIDKNQTGSRMLFL
jgi:hypothetical protein